MLSSIVANKCPVLLLSEVRWSSVLFRSFTASLPTFSKLKNLHYKRLTCKWAACWMYSVNAVMAPHPHHPSGDRTLTAHESTQSPFPSTITNFLTSLRIDQLLNIIIVLIKHSTMYTILGNPLYFYPYPKKTDLLIYYNRFWFWISVYLLFSVCFFFTQSCTSEIYSYFHAEHTIVSSHCRIVLLQMNI